MPRLATKQINFRVTDEELMILEEYAGRAGLKLPAYCKAAALKIKVRPQIIDREIGKAILPQLSHIGGNINQLAKRANEGGTVAAAELAEVKAEMEKIWDYLLTGKKPEKQEETKSQDGNEKEKMKLKEEKLDDSPKKCSKCGELLDFRHSERENKDYWICPNYSREEKGHYFKWVE